VAALQGFNVALFTLEVSTEVYTDRLDALNTDTEIKELPARVKDVAAKLKSKKPSGEVIIFEYPTKRLTVSMIENQVRKLEMEQGITIDMVVADYADIMKPDKHYTDKLQEQASIYEDLRALATILDVPVLTASQVNRAGSDKPTIKGKDTAGTWEKIMVGDAIISLSASDADLQKGEMKVHFAECRNMPSATIKIKTAYNMGRFYKEFLGEVKEVT
jgi:replicative DNA helicase